MRIERFSVGPLDNNLYLLTSPGSREAIVVDPSMESGHVIREIERRGLIVRRILLTHAHFDHIVMTKAFEDATGAPVWLHDDERLIHANAAAAARLWGFEWPGDFAIAHWMKDGEDVGIAGIELRAIHTPGHSPGSVTFVTPHGLVSGDVLFQGSVGRTDLPGGDWDTLVRTIRSRLFSCPPETHVYPGHGPPTTIGDEMRWNPFVGTAASEPA